MAQIPQYGDRKVQTEALPGARVTPAAADVPNFGPQLDKVTGLVTQIAQREKQRADEIALTDFDSGLSALTTKLQIEAQQRRGKDALGLPDTVMADYEKGVADLEKSLGNDDQRAAARRAAISRQAELNGVIQRHVAVEIEKYDDETTDAYLTNERNAAALNAFDQEAVKRSIARQFEAVDRHLARKGIRADSEEGKAIVSARRQEVASKTIESVIDTMISSGDSAKADEFLKANRRFLTAQALPGVERAVEAGRVRSMGEALLPKVQGMMLADGQTPDEAAMRRYIEQQPEIAPDSRDRVWAYVQARVGEQTANRKRFEYANNEKFQNEIIKAQESGMQLKDALSLVEKYQVSPQDAYSKTLWAQKLYSGASYSDPMTYETIKALVDSGANADAEINSALEQGTLSAKGAASLRGKSDSLEMKNTWERIKMLAQEKYSGSSKSRQAERAAFVFELRQSAAGKKPDELWALAQAKLKEVPKDSGWGTVTRWKADAAARDANRLAVSGLSDPAAFRALATSGVYGDAEANRNVQRAVKSLSELRDSAGNPVPITTNNIRAFLDRYPTGEMK